MRPEEGKRVINLTPGQAVGGVLIVFVVSALLTYGAFAVYQPEVAEAPEEDVVTQADNYPELRRAFELIMEEHVDEGIAVESLIEGAMRGAVQATDDRYSTYFDTSEVEDFIERYEGEYSGVGMSILLVDDYVTVMVPFEGTPAATTPYEGAEEGDPVGIQSGDRILQVDGLDVVGMAADHVAELIRGPAGEVVQIVVERDREDEDSEELTFKVERAEIRIPTVTSEMLDNDVGLVALSNFTAHTPDQLHQHLSQLQEQGASGIVLDLRFNPGGSLDACVQAADIFVPEGPVVTIRDREGGEESLEAEQPGFDLPVVVLVNEYSISGAELLAGALRDRLDAPLVGETTFGKGLVQRMWYLDRDESSGLNISTAEYLTPDGFNIEQEGGLTPDYQVPFAEDGQLGSIEDDPQLQKGVEVLLELMEK